MKTLKRLHRNTELSVKIGLPILALIILPLLVSITIKVLTTQNIIF